MEGPTFPSPVRIGTRGSRLALTQAERVRSLLEKVHRENQSLAFELLKIRTVGDRHRSAPLREMGGAGLFTREIETALLEERIELAVHSLKDLPIRQPEGLAILAVPLRAPAEDVLVSRSGRLFADLPPGSRVGTGSLRRQAQTLCLRPDLRILPIRGNVDTRLRKLREGHYDAIVLARAGMERLGLQESITEILPVDRFLPAPGQGALAVEARDRDSLRSLLAPLNDPDSAMAVRAERAVLDGLGGGCHLPLGVHAMVKHQQIHLHARVLSPDGKQQVEAKTEGPKESIAGIVKETLKKLRDAGAAGILTGLYPA